MANRRRRYCVYFSRRYVDVFNTFYFVFKIFYFLSKIFYFLSKIFYFLSKIFYFVSKIFYFVSKIFSSVYFSRRTVGVFRAFNFACKIFNVRLEKAEKNMSSSKLSGKSDLQRDTSHLEQVRLLLSIS